MTFSFRRPAPEAPAAEAAAQPDVSVEAVGVNKFVGETTGTTVDLDAEHAADGRRHVRPHTEADRFECEAETESLRSRADVLHATRDAIGDGEVDRAMESFLVQTGLCDPYSEENFSIESLDLTGDRSPIPAALDREIGRTEDRIRHNRNLTL